MATNYNTFEPTLAWAMALPAKTALLVVPGKPAVQAVAAVAEIAAVVDDKGVVITPAVPAVAEVKAVAAVADKIVDVSHEVEDLYYLAHGITDSKWAGTNALPALRRLKMVDTDAAYIVVHYASKVHLGYANMTFHQALERAKCSYECYNDDVIAKAEAAIKLRKQEILSLHKDAQLAKVGMSTVKKGGPTAADLEAPGDPMAALGL
jgi:hypothetical protein